MQSLTEQLFLYRSTHADNKLAHYVGIPAFLLSILLLFSWISITFGLRWHVSFTWLIVIATLVYYYFLNAKLAGVMTILLFLITLLCTWIAFPAPDKFSLVLFLILFIGGGTIIFIARAPKDRASFYQIISSLLIAPLVLLVEGIEKLGLQKSFNLPVTSITTDYDPYSNHVEPRDPKDPQ